MNIAHLEQLQKTGKIRGYNIVNEKQVTAIPKSKPVEAEGLAHIKWVLQKRGIIFVEEHRFHTQRKFRFDIALLQFKIAAEYEGIYSKKSRHTTQKGYTRDTVKYNVAAIEGWKVLRYTSGTYKDFENDLVEILLNLKPTN